MLLRKRQDVLIEGATQPVLGSQDDKVGLVRCELPAQRQWGFGCRGPQPLEHHVLVRAGAGEGSLRALHPARRHRAHGRDDFMQRLPRLPLTLQLGQAHGGLPCRAWRCTAAMISRKRSVSASSSTLPRSITCRSSGATRSSRC